jgi:Fic family protein
MKYIIPELPLKTNIETHRVLKQTILSNKKLGELKGTVKSVPNANIIINTLALQEAKDSSAIESIITTQDELYKAELFVQHFISPAAKEVQTYAEALKKGYNEVKQKGLLTNNTIISICNNIKMNNAGFRTTPGTSLVNQSTNEVVYEPPQSIDEINKHMSNLEAFINNNELSDLDPLVKMAIIHHQFESIHPFGDGNGRTGRIINILYLVQQKLLDIPVLYLSRYIIKNKAAYYERLQAVRDNNEWEEWILFILKGVEETSVETIRLVEDIKTLMQKFKVGIRKDLSKIYSQDLLNNLFRHPYTKIDFVMKELNVSRPTASSYLTHLEKAGYINKMRIGRDNFYVNIELYDLLLNEFHDPDIDIPSIESTERI